MTSIFTKGKPDAAMVLGILSLVVLGWVMVYSSSALIAESKFQDQYFFLKRQVMWSLIGFLGLVVALNTPLLFWQKLTKPLYLVTFVSLVMVLIWGPEIGGARRWFRIGGYSLQPSEVAKLVGILIVADYLDRRQSRLGDFKRGILPILGLILLLMVPIFLEPDLGTPVLMGLIFVSLLIVAGARWKHLFLMGGGALVVFGLGLIQFPYRTARIFAYLDPWSDPRGAGYQLIQSLLALGSGGIFGRGLGASRLKISHLPDPHTDFVFSVIGEEIGLIGTLLCVGLFLFICVKGLKVSRHAPTLFAQLLGVGISLGIGFQALINMGVASGLFPTKGIPLPFLSFGGSSLVIFLVGIGILIRISALAHSNRMIGGSG
jgi:cell division protein FtsW